MLEVIALPLTYPEAVGLPVSPKLLSPDIERDGCFWDVAEAFRMAEMGRFPTNGRLAKAG